MDKRLPPNVLQFAAEMLALLQKYNMGVYGSIYGDTCGLRCTLDCCDENKNVYTLNSDAIELDIHSLTELLKDHQC